MNNENQLQEQVVQLQPINTTNQKGSKVISIIIGIFLLVAIIGGLSWMYFTNNDKNKDQNINKNENNNVDDNNNNNTTGEITIEKLRTYPETDASEFEYSENNGEITIDNFIGKSEIVVVPEKIDGKYVTTIGKSSFANSKIKAVSTGKNVLKIDKNAFVNSSVAILLMQDSTTTLGEYAFAGCESLSAVVLSKNLTNIGTSVFSMCESLKTIKLPVLKNIGMGMFSDSGLTEITIPNGVENIENVAFGGCSELVNVYIPDSVKTIGKAAFDSSPNIKIITTSGSYAEQFSKDNNIPVVIE